MARNIAREGEEPDYKEIEDPNLIKVMHFTINYIHVPTTKKILL